MNGKFSSLFCLEPLYIESPFVESLTSYICRIAEAHSVLVGALINKIIVPLLNKEYLNKSSTEGGSRFYEYSSAINGVGKTSEEMIQSFEFLTFRNDLKYLTMNPSNKIIPAKGLMRPFRAWCPVCFEDSYRNNEPIYEPLLWSIKVVSHCPTHGIKLSEVCSLCSKKNYALSRYSRVGYCSACGSWLGKPDLNSGQEKLGEYERYINQNVREIITLLPTAMQIDKVFFTENLQTLINQVSSGSIKKFAKNTGIPLTNLRVWKDGKHQPSLEWLIKIGYMMGIQVYELLFKEIFREYNKESINTLNDAHNKQVRKKCDNQQVLEKLDQYKNSNTSTSLREISRSLDVNRRVLYSHFPEQCKAIVSKNKAIAELNKQKRISTSQDIIKDAVANIAHSGYYPSRRRVEAYIGRRAFLRERTLQESWIAARDEIDI